MKSTRSGEITSQNANKILASLPEASSDWVQSLDSVTLQAGTVLYEADQSIDHVYFLNNALVSIMSQNSQGATVEIGSIGHEGMVGVPATLGGVMPYRAVVQMTGEAFRIQSDMLYQEFRNNPLLRDLLLKYTNAFIIQIAQSSLCTCYHTLQERLCRWLLVARDAIGSDVLVVTHEVIARLLGTRRASITVTAGLLQRAGLLRINRGQLTILDPTGLQALSCECYGFLREGLRRAQVS
jgi:CRP-like cAMP-binding protein